MTMNNDAESVLTLLKTLEDDARRVTGKAQAMGQWSTAIQGVRVEARISKLRASVTRAASVDRETRAKKKVIIEYPVFTEEQTRAIEENTRTIDMPPGARRRRF